MYYILLYIYNILNINIIKLLFILYFMVLKAIIK